MAQFTEEQREQLGKMGFVPGFVENHEKYVTGGESGDHPHDQRVWNVSETDWFSRGPYADFMFVADDRLSGIELQGGKGIGFDCPIAAATWLLLQEANRV